MTLQPYPDRMNASVVCSQWMLAVRSPLLHKRILSVEYGARNSTSSGSGFNYHLLKKKLSELFLSSRCSTSEK